MRLLQLHRDGITVMSAKTSCAETVDGGNAHVPPCAERAPEGGKAFRRACEPFVLPLRVPRGLRYSLTTGSKKKVGSYPL